MTLIGDRVWKAVWARLWKQEDSCQAGQEWWKRQSQSHHHHLVKSWRGGGGPKERLCQDPFPSQSCQSRRKVGRYMCARIRNCSFCLYTSGISRLDLLRIFDQKGLPDRTVDARYIYRMWPSGKLSSLEIILREVRNFKRWLKPSVNGPFNAFFFSFPDCFFCWKNNELSFWSEFQPWLANFFFPSLPSFLSLPPPSPPPPSLPLGRLSVKGFRDRCPGGTSAKGRLQTRF